MNELDNIDFIYSDNFRKTKEFKAWHQSFADLIKLFRKVTNDNTIDIKSDDFKDYVYLLKGKHLLRSVELGVYFQNLEKKE